MENVMTGRSILDRMLAPLGECLNEEAARRIVALEIGPDIVARVEELAEKANEGRLTDEERDQYRSYVDAADLIAVFQAKARHQLMALDQAG